MAPQGTVNNATLAECGQHHRPPGQRDRRGELQRGAAGPRRSHLLAGHQGRHQRPQGAGFDRDLVLPAGVLRDPRLHRPDSDPDNYDAQGEGHPPHNPTHDSQHRPSTGIGVIGRPLDGGPLTSRPHVGDHRPGLGQTHRDDHGPATTTPSSPLLPPRPVPLVQPHFLRVRRPLICSATAAAERSRATRPLRLADGQWSRLRDPAGPHGRGSLRPRTRGHDRQRRLECGRGSLVGRPVQRDGDLHQQVRGPVRQDRRTAVPVLPTESEQPASSVPGSIRVGRDCRVGPHHPGAQLQRDRGDQRIDELPVHQLSGGQPGSAAEVRLAPGALHPPDRAERVRHHRQGLSPGRAARRSRRHRRFPCSCT